MKVERVSKGKRKERCVLNSGELVVQRLSASVSGKAQKYSRVGPGEFVSFPNEELTIQNIKSSCNKHFASVVSGGCKKHFASVVSGGLVCVAGDQGRFCRTLEQLPDTKVIHVRFIERFETETDGAVEGASVSEPKRNVSCVGSPSKSMPISLGRGMHMPKKQFPKSLSISKC